MRDERTGGRADGQTDGRSETNITLTTSFAEGIMIWPHKLVVHSPNLFQKQNYIHVKIYTLGIYTLTAIRFCLQSNSGCRVGEVYIGSYWYKTGLFLCWEVPFQQPHPWCALRKINNPLWVHKCFHKSSFPMDLHFLGIYQLMFTYFYCLFEEKELITIIVFLWYHYNQSCVHFTKMAFNGQ